MMILDEAKEWSLKRIIQPNTQAILLTGSWVTGKAKFTSDIELIVIVNKLPSANQNEKLPFKDRIIDVWYYDKEYLEMFFKKEIEKLSDIYNISQFLFFLQNCHIWFDKGSYIQEYINLAKNWKWNPADKRFLKMKAQPPTKEWAKRAYEENLKLLQLAEKNFDEGKPISHRLSDYSELIEKVAKNKVEVLFKGTISVYKNMNIEREWMELSRATKAIKDEDWSSAFASIKDIIRLLIRRNIESAPLEFRNPVIWKIAEEQNLPDEILNLAKLAYT